MGNRDQACERPGNHLHFVGFGLASKRPKLIREAQCLSDSRHGLGFNASVKTLEIGPAGRRELDFDQCQQRTATRIDFLKGGNMIAQSGFRSFFNLDLGESDDVIDPRQQLVPQVNYFTHAFDRAASRRSIFSISRPNSIGFVS